MAFLPGDEEEDQAQAAFDEEQPLAAAPGAGAGAGAAGAVPTTLPEAGAQQQSDDAGFTDTGTYLAANRPQSEALGEFIGGRLQTERETLESDIPGSFDPYRADIEASRTPEGSELIGRAAEDPTSFISDPEDVKRFEQQRTAQYEGPTELEMQPFYSELGGRLTDVEKRPGQVESEKGRESLLFEMVDRPTAGQVTLDQLLLGASPEARARLSSAVAPTADIRPDFESRVSEAKGARGSAMESAEAARPAVQDRFYGEGGAATEFGSELESRLQTERTSQEAQARAAVQDLLDKGPLSPASAQYLGITSRAGHAEMLKNLEALQADYGSPLTVEQFLQETPVEGKLRGVETTALPEDLAKQQALQQLLGSDYNAPLMEEYMPEGGIRDFRLADFDESSINRQSELALMEADKGLAEIGLNYVKAKGPNDPAGAPMFPDEKKAQQFYNMLLRNPHLVGGDTISSSPESMNRKFVELYDKEFGANFDDYEPPEDTYTPPPSDMSPWAPGQPRLRVVEGQEPGQGMKWWDGGQWVKAPTEMIWLDADGNRTNPGDAQTTQQFDFNTGEYTTIWTRPEGSQQDPPGIVRAF